MRLPFFHCKGNAILPFFQEKIRKFCRFSNLGMIEVYQPGKADTGKNSGSINSRETVPYLVRYFSFP